MKTPIKEINKLLEVEPVIPDELVQNPCWEIKLDDKKIFFLLNGQEKLSCSIVRAKKKLTKEFLANLLNLFKENKIKEIKKALK